VDTTVVAAFITALGAVVVALLQRARKENAADHASVMALIRIIGRKIDKLDSNVDRVEDKISQVEHKIDNHTH
jgi:hypothetical protein